MKIDITPLVLTLNEQENIARTLGALSWTKEVLIVDSGSTDATLEIAISAHPNVRIVRRPFDTHANQWNFGLAQVKTEWVLSLDADYEVTSELASEIQSLEPSQEVVGYEAKFEYRIFGHPLRASVYPSRVVLFRPGQCSYYDDGHTQRLRTNGVIRALNGKIYHDDRKPFKRWIDSQQAYAKLEARHLLSMPSEQLNFPDRLRRWIVFAPPAMFLYLLFGRGLILNGWPGWFYVCQRTIAEILLSIRLMSGQHELELRGADK